MLIQIQKTYAQRFHTKDGGVTHMADWHTHVCTSTYTADVSGVCSMLYELGGMTVLHDPSGCNSTYTTHDEPRWYDTNSLMFYVFSCTTT